MTYIYFLVKALTRGNCRPFMENKVYVETLVQRNILARGLPDGRLYQEVPCSVPYPGEDVWSRHPTLWYKQHSAWEKATERAMLAWLDQCRRDPSFLQRWLQEDKRCARLPAVPARYEAGQLLWYVHKNNLHRLISAMN